MRVALALALATPVLAAPAVALAAPGSSAASPLASQASTDPAIAAKEAERAAAVAELEKMREELSELVIISSRDSRLIDDVRLARQERLWLQESLSQRMELLSELQASADEQRSRIGSDLAAQQARATELGADIANLLREKRVASYAGGDPLYEFNPDTVISATNFRDADSMTAEDIQAFLDRQPGTLKSYRAPDHNGVVKSTAQMIAEASAAWKVSPKVILVKLQKEQSLLANPSPTKEAYDWALGCGRADSKTYYEYQGFGNQIWWGAYKLNKNAGPWRPGIEMSIDGSPVRPTNSSTYSLYKYTPHLRGTMSFWMIYWRYFGDPLVPAP